RVLLAGRGSRRAPADPVVPDRAPAAARGGGGGRRVPGRLQAHGWRGPHGDDGPGAPGDRSPVPGLRPPGGRRPSRRTCSRGPGRSAAGAVRGAPPALSRPRPARVRGVLAPLGGPGGRGTP